jgi:predicted CopG family antitoxin
LSEAKGMDIRMKKNLKLLLLFSLLAVIIISAVAYANATGNKIFDPFVLGKQFSQIDKNPGKIVLINNEIPITKGEFNYVLSLMDKENLSSEKIIKTLVRRKLLYEIAKREGVAISENEATHIVEEEKETFQNLQQEHKQYLLEFIKGIGVSEEDYWNNYFLEDVIIFESINNLGKKVVQSAIDNGELVKEPSGEDVEAHKEWGYLTSEYFNNWGDNKVTSAKVDILDQNFINSALKSNH